MKRLYFLESEVVIIENQPALKKSYDEKYSNDYIVIS